MKRKKHKAYDEMIIALQVKFRLAVKPPPGKPGKLRAEHFGAITVPCLFVSGTRDQFATPDELEAATAPIQGPVTHVTVENGDHGLRRRDQEVAAVVAGWVLALRR